VTKVTPPSFLVRVHLVTLEKGGLNNFQNSTFARLRP
jgi:hypothetical protein